MAESVEFHGQTFAVPDRINSRRINQLAVIGKQAAAAEKAGDETRSAALMQDYMALVEALIVQSVRPEDRDRFDALCDEVCPSDEEMMTFVGEVAAAIGGRPTQRSSGSSSGPTTTSEKSADVSSLPVTPAARLESQGRPDLALIVEMSQANRSA